MKSQYKLNKTIQLLTYNSRATTKEIARETNTSQQNASHLLAKLEKDKFVHNYSLLVDSSKFGHVNFWILLRVKKYSRSFLNEFYSEIKKYKEITATDFLFGDYDILLKITANNSSHFNKILAEILNKYADDLYSHLILHQIVVYNYPSNYLSKKKYETKVIVSGDREAIKINRMDQEIINILNENSRTSLVEISKKVKTTPKTVSQRMKKLEDSRVIRGYNIVKNHQKLGINRHYIFLSFEHRDFDVEKKLIQFTQFSTNVIEVIRIFGKWDMILVVETKAAAEFKNILSTIKEDFFEIIKDYSFVESEEIKLWKYLPELEV